MTTHLEDTASKLADWQAIETAPLDKSIYLYCEETGEMGEGYYTQNQYALFSGSFFLNNGGYTDGGNGNDYKCNASHWLPLPKPPSKP